MRAYVLHLFGGGIFFFNFWGMIFSKGFFPLSEFECQFCFNFSCMEFWEANDVVRILWGKSCF